MEIYNKENNFCATLVVHSHQKRLAGTCHRFRTLTFSDDKCSGVDIYMYGERYTVVEDKK
ncbi:hypothetical protein [Coxiella endosymbiont of Ornithodoros maritimus]|uniref:hypothetical protein n=1 Tax=Coxiella endosymbiont of Ornithodoros maritimus TaxID=1656172 RepID=UPI002263CFC6|nr:hypothetical protein [Coxiella endosymbiont of Ornithodoros maritimus]